MCTLRFRATQLKFWRFLSRHCLYSKSHINGRYLCSLEAFNMIDHLQVYNTIYWAQNQGKISPSTSNLDDGFGQIPVVYNFLVRIWHSHDRYTYKLFGVEKTWNISKRWRFLLETANLEHLRNHEDSEMVKVSWRQGMSTWRHSMFSLPENTTIEHGWLHLDFRIKILIRVQSDESQLVDGRWRSRLSE